MEPELAVFARQFPPRPIDESGRQLPLPTAAALYLHHWRAARAYAAARRQQQGRDLTRRSIAVVVAPRQQQPQPYCRLVAAARSLVAST
jgi:hypothetical protein